MAPGERRPKTGFGGPRRHPDLPEHSRSIRAEVDELRLRHLARSQVLGVDPRLVLVVELGARVDADEFRKAGLRVLDSSDQSIVVAFSDDPQLAGFLERLDACAGGVPTGQQSEPYAAFVDAIDRVRPLGPADRITAELEATIIAVPPTDTLRLDIELWHPGDHDRALDWVANLRQAVSEVGGQVIDTYLNDAAGVILNRVYAPAGSIAALAEIDVIALMDVLPTPSLTRPQLWAATPDDLPTMAAPAPDAPIVGLVDSGVASAHPLIAPALLAAEALSSAIADGEDRSGHGTMVAGLILHGALDAAIGRGITLSPLCRLVSVAVLDHTTHFPDADVWERDLVEAIEWCADQGATIINLSIGDKRRPFRTPRQMPAAALVDELIRRRDLVVVVSAGNTHPVDYLPETNAATVLAYPVDLLGDARTGILDPGTAALALTVGGITDAKAATGYSSQESPIRRPVGQPGWPSPVTRRGPGVAGSIKPEVVERAGTLGMEVNRLVGNDAELAIISTALTTGRLLGFDIGTSMATPPVTRVAAAVKTRHPSFGANLTRALVLLSAQPTGFETDLIGATVSVRANATRMLMGYGRPSIARAIESTSHRVVLVAEQSIAVDGVHMYELTMPSSFTTSGGSRGIDVALAFNPRTRASRLDYFSSKMEFVLFRGVPLDEVLAVVAKADENIDLEVQLEAGATDSDEW
ncbi:MAG: hypothetical protein QOJ60_307, partial [Actinomycetota bacterium]|nr:hypothetical protein [Actinomycetota bacterium]